MAWQLNKVNVMRGAPEQFMLVVLDAINVPVNLSGIQTIAVKIKKQDGSILEKACYAGWTWGKRCPVWAYGFELSASETSCLPVGVDLTVEIKAGFGSDNFQFFAIKKCLTVVDQELI